jgi:hypothetical protein
MELGIVTQKNINQSIIDSTVATIHKLYDKVCDIDKKLDTLIEDEVPQVRGFIEKCKNLKKYFSLRSDRKQTYKILLSLVKECDRLTV